MGLTEKKFWSIATGILILDQATKFVIRTFDVNLDLRFLQINTIQNTGIAFGLFKNMNFVWALVSAIVILAICYNTGRILKQQDTLGWALILGGATGNLLDRLLLGGVIDFIDLGWWPAFNIADSALSVGIIYLLYMNWKEK